MAADSVVEAQASEEMQCDTPQRIAVTDVQAVASYNWVDEGTPTILVPGRPARWSPPEDPPTLPPDTGSFFVDHNMARMPSSPFTPAIKAILHLQPDFDFTRLDIITDRWALAQLLELACEHNASVYTAHKREKPTSSVKLYSFAIQLVGSTLIFQRTHDASANKKDIRSFNGFRKELGKEYFAYDNDVSGSVAHFRMTSYKLGGLRLLVRNGADGYVRHEAVASLTDDDVRTSTMQDATDHGLSIRSAGSLVPTASLLELNTMSAKDVEPEDRKRVTDKRREAWISQTGHFMLAGWMETTKGGRQRGVDFKCRRAFFPDEKMKSMDVIEPSASLTETYHGMLQSIIAEVLRRAASGQGDRYTATQYMGKWCPVIEPCADLAALPDELCERMKTPR